MFVTRDRLAGFVRRLDAAFARPGKLYLIGETTHVFEGWQRWTDEAHVAADVSAADRPAFEEALVEAAGALPVLDEHPADLIPLPDGYEARAHAAVYASEGDGATGEALTRHLSLHHFDPYSVAFRFIARGSEPDYHLVLTYLDHGWITFETMDRLLDGLLPRFSFETIAQDPAEFRRKYKGLRQMAARLKPGVIHRPF